jgi:putative ABC transport system ATP-binding protein|tara:strand:+ start:8741 stop:9478 length:738 start_codon:yes stop_codon:yes gene_type:complete
LIIRLIVNPNQIMLEIKQLHKSYAIGDSSLHVLKGIDLSVAQGEMVAIMGSSGSGKSTLLNIIGMLDEADGGDYILDEVPIKNLTEKKAAIYRNKFLGFIFQSFNLINYKNALENVALPLYYQGLKRKERQEKARFHLEKVGLLDWQTHLPSELSGGQKQRVAIARALASDPKLLLADEPTGALDTTTSYDIMAFLQQLNDEGKTILIVTHEEDIAAMCKRIVRLRDGIIMEDKKVTQVRAEAHV